MSVLHPDFNLIPSAGAVSDFRHIEVYLLPVSGSAFVWLSRALLDSAKGGESSVSAHP